MLRVRVNFCRWTLAAACIVSALAVANDGRADTLTGALAAAYWNNPDINVARAQTRVVDENLPIAKSGNRPTVSANADLAGITSDAPRASDSVDGSIGLSFTQNLFSGFRTKNAKLEAEASILASRQALESTIQDVLFDAAQAYMNVLRDQALLELQRTNVGFLDEQLKAAQDRFDVGENTRTDVAQTRAQLSGSQASVSLAEANLKASQAVYRQVIGKEPGKLAPGYFYKRLLPPSLTAAIDLGLSGHPAILAAIYNADAAAYIVKQVEGELLPTVSIQGSAEHIFGIHNSTSSNAATITGRVSVPIYQGGGVSARVRQSKETLGLRQIQIDVSRAQVRAAVVSSWGQLDAANASIIATRAQVAASQIALDGVQEEQRVGQRTTLDVLNAQQVLVNARANLVVAQRDSVVASFLLLSAAGLLNANTLNLPVERYNAEAHYIAVKDKWFGLRTPDGR